jgi:hypothetical protein
MAPNVKKAPRKERNVEVRPSQAEKDLVGFQAGHHAIVSGASGRGKTEYTVDAVLGEGVHRYHKPQWDAVVVMCDNVSIDQPAFQRLEERFTGEGGVKFIEGLPQNPEDEEEFLGMLKEHNNDGLKTILIIDDLMNASSVGSAERFVSKLFTSARHLKTDVWELTQRHTGNRTRRLNCGYLVCFATPADVKSLSHICNSIRPETKGRDVLQAYRVATESHDGHGCLVICLQQPGRFMFRNTSKRYLYPPYFFHTLTQTATLIGMNVCFDLDGVPVDADGVPRLGARYS